MACEAARAVWDSAAGCTSDGRDDCDAAGVEAFATSAVTGVGTTVAAGAVLEAVATAAAVGDVATATCRGATRLAMLALLAALVAAIAGVVGVPATERLGANGTSLEMGVIPPGPGALGKPWIEFVESHRGKWKDSFHVFFSFKPREKKLLLP